MEREPESLTEAVAADLEALGLTRSVAGRRALLLAQLIDDPGPQCIYELMSNWSMLLDIALTAPGLLRSSG